MVFSLVMNHRFLAHNSNGSTDGNSRSQVMGLSAKDTQWCIWFAVSHNKQFNSHMFETTSVMLVKWRVSQVLRCHALQGVWVRTSFPRFPVDFSVIKSLAKDLDVCLKRVRSSKLPEMSSHWWWRSLQLPRPFGYPRWLEVTEVPSPIPEPHIDLIVDPGPGSRSLEGLVSFLGILVVARDFT